MRIYRCWTLLLAASLCLTAGCGGRKKLPPPDDTVIRWWRAVAAGDRDGAAAYVAERARKESSARLAAYAEVKKCAETGDELAVRMSKRLEGVRIGEAVSGAERATVKLVMSDGRPFLTVYLKWRNGRWEIFEFK